MIDIDQKYMQLALEMAKLAVQKEEVPVGAVLVSEGLVISKKCNLVESLNDATAHAELLCIQEGARRLGSWRLLGTTLYTTLEPCSMCLGAILLARVSKVVYGAPDIRHGACGSFVNLLNQKHPTHTLEIKAGVYEDESRMLLKNFFKKRRSENAKLRQPRITT